MAEKEISLLYLEAVEETKDQNREFDKAWRAQRKSMDSGKNSKSVLAMCGNADRTRRSLKRSARPCWIL